MSLWGVHVGVAGIATVLVLFVLAPGYRYRWVVTAASGLWAVLPDFHHALDALPTVQAGWRAFHGSAFADLFWFHRVIDRADPGDSRALSLAMWAILLAVVVTTELLTRRRERTVRSERAARE